MPTDGLIGIAVEGLAPIDQTDAAAEAIEVADLVLYYGHGATFDRANAVVIIQFKYSIGSERVPFRANDAIKTLRKFAATLRGHKRKYGAKAVHTKLGFELITNRLVHPGFTAAVRGLASGSPLTGDAHKQAKQFETACGLRGRALVEFAQQFRVSGLAGSLPTNKQMLSRVLADWSQAPDALARARLGNLRRLVRDKAGSEGDGRNVIDRTDVLSALELQGPDDLFPCPASFPEVGKVVQREGLAAVLAMIPKRDRPLLIHAAGGLGKTVFLQSITKALSDRHETVLFDCFGGGSYRSPSDSRHLPQRGLVHIANTLACKGLCDPLLPGNDQVEDLIRAFRVRLTQAATTLHRASRDRQLLLFLDAIDNAAEHARDKGEPAFPTLLLESFHYSGAIPGVQLIVSCRTHRRDISLGEVPCEQFCLTPFSFPEATQYLSDRIETLTDTEARVAYSRSSGNPRILEHLAGSDRGLLEASELGNTLQLDDLLKARIERALGEARTRGHKDSDIRAFLAGLSVLPPPVPVREYADAHGMHVAAVESFAADLAPLLEQTRYGLTFRDEPTETLVRESYAASAGALRIVATNLIAKQGESVYAASALPGLLQQLGDGTRLFELAFDQRFPQAIASTVGKLNIRHARLKAAVRHFAPLRDFNRLVHLLLELSTLAAVNDRGTSYVLDNPDLVVAAHDVDAMRRLFETRTHWAGTRHARLTIASALAGDLDDAHRHAVNAYEWILHFSRQNDDTKRELRGPTQLDVASIALYLVAQNRSTDAARYLARWKDWYAYEVSEDLFALLDRGDASDVISPGHVTRFLTVIKTQPGLLAGALSFSELTTSTRRRLIRALGRTCRSKGPLGATHVFHRERHYVLEHGLLKAAVAAVSMGMHVEARAILAALPQDHPRLWAFGDRHSVADLLPFLALSVLATPPDAALHERAFLPAELMDIAARVPAGLAGPDFRSALRGELEKHLASEKALPSDKRSMSYDTTREAERFIDERLELLLEVVRAFAAVALSPAGSADAPFLALLQTWSRFSKPRDRHPTVSGRDRFFDHLGFQFLTFALWARSDLDVATAEAFVQRATGDGVTSVPSLITIAAILAKRTQCHDLAGHVAVTARALAEQEDEVGERANLFARLAKAILPASSVEAASYFRLGLEQMDAIGSGDYPFTNELLMFCSAIPGGELADKDVHTLNNICELNMSSEERKFPWLPFGRGLARTSGCRTLARLGRWHDRTKISLDFTLLPYLTALLEQDKIDPRTAVSLMRLCRPAELRSCGTGDFATAIERKQHPQAKLLVAELIDQFLHNRPGIFMPSTVKTLSEVAERVLGIGSDHFAYLSVAAKRFSTTRDEENHRRTYQGAADSLLPDPSRDGAKSHDRSAIFLLAQAVTPTDGEAVSRALDGMDTLRSPFDRKAEFFECLRPRVGFHSRAKYLDIVSRLENLNIYAKLQELKACKAKWFSSSNALSDTFRDLGIPLVRIHAKDFVSDDYLSDWQLTELSDLSGVPLTTLVLELITVFSAPDSHLPASVWMGVASVICRETDPAESQAALRRLLNSNAARLSSSVLDGEWKEGLYPAPNATDTPAELVWLVLGSPLAADRWQAAHSVRTLARLGQWAVVDALVAKLTTTDAHPYQAPELAFYFLHARLWLLIALARLALDYPADVAKYIDALKRIAMDKDTPHILLRHFAATALLACADRTSPKLSKADTGALKAITTSPFPRKEARTESLNVLDVERPASIPTPTSAFSLDYDFRKFEIQSLCNMFDRLPWEIEDLVTAWVRKFDSTITSMYDDGGRRSGRDELPGMTRRHHSYGEYLAWHALFLTAGECLARYPIASNPYDDEDPWREWLNDELLTRKDGLWLADGVDRPPVEIQINLLDNSERGLVLTTSKEKLLAVGGIAEPLRGWLSVDGHWHSNDGVRVYLSSALVPPARAKALALELSKEDPFRAHLPLSEERDEEKVVRNSRAAFMPWVVRTSMVASLDEADPLAASSVVRRMHFTTNVDALGSLLPTDAFKRAWVSGTGEVVARSEAWGRGNTRDDEDSNGGQRLLCSTDLLQTILQARNADLLLLIILRRYQKEHARPSQYWHTTAVVHIPLSLKFTLYPGVENKLHVSRF